MSHCHLPRFSLLLLMLCVPTGVLVAATAQSDAQAEQPSDSPKELSVAPLDHVEYPESRPTWVSDFAEPEQGAYRMVVVSGPADSVEESQDELRVLQRAAVTTLISQIVPSDGHADFYSPSDEEIEQHLVVRQYAGEVKQGDQTRYEHAAELMISESLEQQVRRAWQNDRVQHRLGAVGLFGVAGLGLLSCGLAVTGTISRRVQRKEWGRNESEPSHR